jgi:hypothetical protein
VMKVEVAGASRAFRDAWDDRGHEHEVAIDKWLNVYRRKTGFSTFEKSYGN